MSPLFEVTAYDRAFYKERLAAFLPDRIIDIHTHVWLEEFRQESNGSPLRAVTWPWRVAKENPLEDLMETYQLMFPGKEVKPMMFSQVDLETDLTAGNRYVSECSRQHDYPSLMVNTPGQSAEEFEAGILDGGFLGSKVYLNFAPTYIPEKEIRIFDFIPHHQLEVLNRRGWILMLHIPRDGRLKDPLNLHQLLEIEHRYPEVKMIVAHVGRAYCPEDVGNAFEVLAETEKMVFDFSANVNCDVFRQLIRCVGPKRILFGSDLPILRMRTKRLCEQGNYINLVPKGLYGDVSGDSHMREVDGPESDELTFFLYEQIDAFRRASISEKLNAEEIEDVFYNNSARLLSQVIK